MTTHQHVQPHSLDWAVGDPPLGLGNLVCAIGNFDGVHKGHQVVLAAARSCSQATGLPLAVVTFTPHPRQYFRPSDPPFLLQNRASKDSCLEALGVSVIIHVQFDKTLQQFSPEAFVTNVLIEGFCVKHLFAGADFAFGKARAGTMSSLAEMGQKQGVNVQPVVLCIDENQQAVSSSRIRAALREGQVEQARDMLGRPFCVSGVVIRGDQRGRLLDFPTANVGLGDCLEPAFGVYAVTADLVDKTGQLRQLKGVTNIGRRPTVNDRGVLAETHLFDFDEDIYGCMLTVYLQAFLRPEQKFDGLDALRDQIAADAAQARKILK